MATVSAASSGSAVVARFGGATYSSRAAGGRGTWDVGNFRGRGSERVNEVQGFTAVSVLLTDRRAGDEGAGKEDGKSRRKRRRGRGRGVGKEEEEEAEEEEEENKSGTEP